MRTARAEDLQRFATGVFVAHGATAGDASTVAGALVKASLLGHDSHGILRIGRYVDKILQRTLHPAARPRVNHGRGAVAVIDGGYGFGHITAHYGADFALQLAHTHGVAAVALHHTNHIGRLGDYAEKIVAGGCIALIFASGAGPGGSVAAFGGRERIFGTNPLAWGLPVPAGRGPLIADFSTAAVPEGKIGMAKSRGDSLPPGAIFDPAGRPSTDPDDYYAGGAILPFGGHKGYSLVLLIEVMASLLANSVPSSSAEYQVGNPTVMIALEVDTFLPMPEYLRHTEALLQRIESSAPAEGFERVLLPNAIELETFDRRQREGIPVPDGLWAELESLGQSSKVAWLT
jgi:uncharacterized oxidoreductase